MPKAIGFWNLASLRFAPLLLAGICLAGSPAHAQFSDSYKFLEAVKKKEGQKVEDSLAEPGSTIINARDVSTGRGALHIVTERRDPTWLRYLIAKGANVNHRDRKGVSPLQIAANLGWIEGVEILVKRDANLDDVSDTGETPLISAVHQRNTTLMKILLEGGADPDRADNSGRSARDYALLDGENGILVQTIESNAEKKDKTKPAPTYGPTF
ncbi:MAG: ankyrin repeat domain-containing protein [Novosphingobium sp.]|nr:ankyrin repeat domain-containing protein [Novosphingobium sp.]